MNLDSKSQMLLLTFRSILETSTDMIFIKDTELVYVAASKSFAKLVNLGSPEKLIGKTDFDIFEEALALRYTEDDRKVLETGTPIAEYIEPLPDRDGKKNYSSTRKNALFDEHGQIIGLYGIAKDVTAQVELEEERERREMSRQMFEGVLEADVNEDRILRVEGSVWAQIPGLSLTRSFTETMEKLVFQFLRPTASREFQNLYSRSALMKRYSTGEREFTSLTELCLDGKEFKWFEFKSRLYYAKLSSSLCLTTVVNDLDEEVKSRQLLKKQAEIDSLTGLLNRQSVTERISACLKGGGASNRHVLLLLDLDHFKQVNDKLGHPFGDLVLKEVAEKLRDLFCADDILGRIGGDEFLILLKNIPGKEEAKRRIQKIYDQIPFYQYEFDPDIYVTCSIGASIYNGDGKTIDELYCQADEAMYRAKEAGKNRLVFYGDDEQ